MNSIIYKYFPDLTSLQKKQIDAIYDIYSLWNSKINVISRKDIDNIYLHHVLHSLAIAKLHTFKAGDIVMDLGCGGGFPGIPLAILFPDVHFKMVDSVGKKLIVVDNVAKELSLDNVEVMHTRAEDIKFQVDYVVSRAVADLSPFLSWCWNNIKSGEGRGVLYLKGGDITQEVCNAKGSVKGISGVSIYDISETFEEEFFETKKIVYITKR